MVGLNIREDGDVYYAANRNENHSFELTSLAVATLNQKKTTVDSGKIETATVNFIYDLSVNRANIDTTNTTASLIDERTGPTSANSAARNHWVAATIYDDNNDNSFNATNWSTTGTTGTVTTSETGGGAGNNETSYAQCLSGGGSGDTAIIYAGTKDFKAGAKDATVYIKCYAQSVTGGRNLQIIQSGTTSINLISLSTTQIYVFRIEIDYSAETCDVYQDGNETPVASAVDISTLSSWYVGVSAIGDAAADPRVRIYYMRYIDSIVSRDVIYTSTTVGATVDTILTHYDADLTAGTISLEVSSNGGTNYDSTSVDTITSITNQSTGVVNKITITSTATVSPELFEYGSFYG